MTKNEETILGQLFRKSIEFDALTSVLLEQHPELKLLYAEKLKERKALAIKSFEDSIEKNPLDAESISKLIKAIS